MVGQVVAEDGQPVADAKAFIYMAGVRTGTSEYCPTCYADCGKKAATGADGGFVIAGLDSTLVFRVLFLADGFEPLVIGSVDPLKGPVTAKLKPRPTLPDDPKRVIRGRVVDGKGLGVAGTTVEVSDRTLPGGVTTSQPKGIDLVAFTGKDGEFAIVATGAHLGGELANARTQYGAEGVSKCEREGGGAGIQTYDGAHHRGAHIGRDGAMTQLGDFAAEPAHTIAGRFTLADGEKFKAGTRLILSRERRLGQPGNIAGGGRRLRAGRSAERGLFHRTGCRATVCRSGIRAPICSTPGSSKDWSTPTFAGWRSNWSRAKMSGRTIATRSCIRRLWRGYDPAGGGGVGDAGVATG